MNAKEPLLRQLFEHGSDLPLSFEVFPPRTPIGEARLAETVGRLAPVAAGFSVTMGAGGSTRDGTMQTAVDIAAKTDKPIMAHMVSLGLGSEQINRLIEDFWGAGIHRVLALRGDRPRSGIEHPANGYDHAVDLVRALRQRHDFEIAVAAYPEKHPEAASLQSDIDHLKEKLDAGASEAICQFALAPETYGRFVDACRKRGITAPIIPGLMPLDNWLQVRRFATMAGASVPKWLDRLLAGAEDTPELTGLVAMAATVEQLRRLRAYGAPGIHIYTMNRWKMPLALARILDQGQPVPLTLTVE